MAKVCEMIVNRDYIRENNADHPPRLIPLRRVRLRRARSRARGRTDARTHARTRGCTYPAGERVRVCMCVRVCVRERRTRVCVCGRDAFTHMCGKKSGLARGQERAGGRRYFFTRNERVQGETCIRLAGGSRGDGGRTGGRMRGEGSPGRAEEVAEGGVGGPPFAVDFSGLFFTGDGPRLPG